VRRRGEVEPARICADDCRYRKLYEGSQRSLSDMASRQAQAVARVGRLRNQLILAAKRAFPRSFTQAERSLGIRMSDAPDEVLVAQLESFLGMSVAAEGSPGVEALRDALFSIGVPVPDGVDLGEWAESVRLHGIDRRDPFATPTAPAPSRTAGRHSIANRELVQNDASNQVQVRGTETSTPAQSLARPSESDHLDDDLDDLFDTPDVAASADHHDRAATDRGPQDEPRSPGRSTIGGPDDAGEPIAAVDDFFGGAGGDADEDVFGDGFDDLFDEQDGPLVGDGPAAGDFDDFFDDSLPAEAPVQPQSPGNASLRGAGPDPGAVVVQGREPEPEAEQTGEDADQEPTLEPLPSWATGRAVKPQLFPPAPKNSPRRDRRASRVRALPADLPDVPVDDRTEPDADGLTDEVRSRLLALSSIPRPVFTSDLVSLVGSEDLVNTWRREWQDGDLSVRFVLPKPRHRLRGALVVPQAALKEADSQFAGSWWGRCMELFRGARLYELGVFFHRFADQVVSFEYEGGVIVVRMSLPQGLTGAVLVADQQLGPGGETREALSRAIERLLSDRLVHIAVLVMNAEQFDPAAQAVEHDARERAWRASMPVTLSRSWEYVEGTGTAVPLLGV
jgi:hypothetical protein